MDKKKLAEHAAEDLLASHEAILQQAKALEIYPQLSNSTLQLVEQLKASPKYRFDLSQQQDSFAAVIASLNLYRHSEIETQFAKIANDIAESHNVMAKYAANFKLPELSYTADLFKQYDALHFAKEAQWATDHFQEIRRSVEAMQTPWLQAHKSLELFGGLTELQGIGIAIREFQSYSDQLADQLRVTLGDWRNPIEWPQAIFTDSNIRHEFYVGIGLNQRLTDFPTATFNEGATRAGLVTEVPPIGIDLILEADEPGFERNNAAHDRLQRFETWLRRFINHKMTEVFGTNWVKQRVPGEIWQRWKEKREQAIAQGGPGHHLLAYADFTDYVPIIIRKDNWSSIFREVFQRQELVAELFQRLYPIRICTMHARIITADDELYLYIETKRILKAIGILKS